MACAQARLVIVGVDELDVAGAGAPARFSHGAHQRRVLHRPANVEVLPGREVGADADRELGVAPEEVVRHASDLLASGSSARGRGRAWTTPSVFVGGVSATYSSRRPCSFCATSAGSTTITWSN